MSTNGNGKHDHPHEETAPKQAPRTWSMITAERRSIGELYADRERAQREAHAADQEIATILSEAKARIGVPASTVVGFDLQRGLFVERVQAAPPDTRDARRKNGTALSEAPKDKATEPEPKAPASAPTG